MIKRIGILVRLGLVFALALVYQAPARVNAFSSTLTEFATTSDNAGPFGITAGPDRNLWFTERNANKIGKMSASGTMLAEYSLPSPGDPFEIISGPDGNLWFTESAGRIAKITTSGVITEYTTPSSPLRLTAGPDGNIWYSTHVSSKVGKVTTSGTVTEYTVLGGHAHIDGITAGPDGNVWFVGNNSINKITTDGTVTSYSITTGLVSPQVITFDSSGNAWFSEFSVNKVGRMTPDGTFTDYAIPSAPYNVYDMQTGPDGNAWFTDPANDKIDTVSQDGVVTEYSAPSGSGVSGVGAGPDGNIWYTDQTSSKIGRITLETDSDNDGILNSIEDAAPNDGDANGDGTPDSQQMGVASLLDDITGQFMAIESSCGSIGGVQIGSMAAAPHNDPAYSYPVGLVGFQVDCGQSAVGSTQTFTQYYYGNFDATKFILRKWQNGAYSTLPGAIFSNVNIGGQAALKVVYQVTDGGPFDADRTANGTIVDPVGPAINTLGVPNTGLGGSGH